MSLDLPAGRLRDERNTADNNVAKLDKDQQARWWACRSSHRFMAFYGKQLVVYRLLFQRPQIYDTLTCRGLDVGLNTGLSSLWESQKDKKQFWVSSTPKEVAPSCFLWMLKYSSLELVEYKGDPSLTFSIAYKTQQNPSTVVDGPFYLLEKAVFDNFQFPES